MFCAQFVSTTLIVKLSSTHGSKSQVESAAALSHAVGECTGFWSQTTCITNGPYAAQCHALNRSVRTWQVVAAMAGGRRTDSASSDARA